MSISPSDAQGSLPSSSSRAHSSNPSFDHGFGSLRRRSRGQPINPQIEGLNGIGLAPEGPASGSLSSSLSESVDAAYGESCNPTTKVAGFKLTNLGEGSYGENSGSVAAYQPTGTDLASSECRSNQFGPAEGSGTGMPSANANFVHSENLTAGSNAFASNATHSALRRNQVVNANHLLNFYYDPISRSHPRLPPPRRPKKIKPYNKDLFLQANYKFVLLDRGDCQIELMDPDKMLQWEDVICVRYLTPFAVQCPICLENPLCPQITSCGHIYCFPCILHYLLMGEEDIKGGCWKKCPLCFMMISTKHLCTVLIDSVKQYRVGDHANFTLLTRPKNSLVPTLKNQKLEDPMLFGSEHHFDQFSKFVLTKDVELSVQEAKANLKDWLQKTNSGIIDDLEKLPYVCAAMEQLEDRMKNWEERCTYHSTSPPGNHSIPTASVKAVPIHTTPSKTDSHALNSHLNYKSAKSDACEPAGGMPYSCLEREITSSSVKINSRSSHVALVATPEVVENCKKVLLPSEVKIFQQKSSNSNVEPEDSYTFYQAIDGQHLILHPLNMKCLLHHYGSYDMLPTRISGKILEMETVTQTEAMRRRYRFLSHFSLTTTFQLCEIELSNVLPPSSFSPFLDEIKKREKQRRRLAKKEEDERARAEAAFLQESLIPFEQRESSANNAVFSPDDFEALVTNHAPSTSPPISGERKLFSDVTRLGFAAAHDSPSLTTEESADSSGLISKAYVGQGTQGLRTTATVSFANIISSTRAGESPDTNKNANAKKGKKPTRVLLTTAGSRRY